MLKRDVNMNMGKCLFVQLFVNGSPHVSQVRVSRTVTEEQAEKAHRTVSDINKRVLLAASTSQVHTCINNVLMRCSGYRQIMVYESRLFNPVNS
jgi:hypothetical protein